MEYLEVKFKDGEPIISEGSSDKTIYIITSGKCNIFVGKTKVRSCGVGEVLGVLAAFTGKPRAASVIAAGKVTAAKITIEDVRSFANTLAAKETFLTSVLTSLIAAIKETNDTLEAIRKVVDESLDKQTEMVARASTSIEDACTKSQSLPQPDKETITASLQQGQKSIRATSDEITVLRIRLSNPRLL